VTPDDCQNELKRCQVASTIADKWANQLISRCDIRWRAVPNIFLIGDPTREEVDWSRARVKTCAGLSPFGATVFVTKKINGWQLDRSKR